MKRAKHRLLRVRVPRHRVMRQRREARRPPGVPRPRQMLQIGAVRRLRAASVSHAGNSWESQRTPCTVAVWDGTSSPRRAGKSLPMERRLKRTSRFPSSSPLLYRQVRCCVAGSVSQTSPRRNSQPSCGFSRRKTSSREACETGALMPKARETRRSPLGPSRRSDTCAWGSASHSD